jgi:hypothetical protein
MNPCPLIVIAVVQDLFSGNVDLMSELNVFIGDQVIRGERIGQIVAPVMLRP